MRLGLYGRLLTVEAVRSLARHKLRTALAMLGNIVGVASVIWVVAIGRAATEQTLAQLDQLGDNLVWVEAGSRTVAGVRTGAKGMNTLTVRDAQAIRDEVPLIRMVSENVDGSIQLQYGNKNWSSRFRGVAPEYAPIKRWDLAKGAFFTQDDVDQAARVVVIGQTVRDELFGEDDPIGEIVRIRGAMFEVVGVLAAKGQSSTGQDQDDTVMMPWTTAMKRVVGKDVAWLDDILCSAVTPEDIPQAADQISALLRDRHHLGDGDLDFNIRHPEDLLQARLDASHTLQLLLLVLASISLLVGGIGIMNVMLAGVVQRTREIGVRVAVGASAFAIQLQFLGEAVVMTLVGGALGVAAAHAFGGVIEADLGWPLAMGQDASVLAVGFSVAVGVFFGLYPAVRASQLDPIAALRDE
jgi:putative ABC transport system permease protein